MIMFIYGSRVKRMITARVNFATLQSLVVYDNEFCCNFMPFSNRKGRKVNLSALETYGVNKHYRAVTELKLEITIQF